MEFTSSQEAGATSNDPEENYGGGGDMGEAVKQIQSDPLQSRCKTSAAARSGAFIGRKTRWRL